MRDNQIIITGHVGQDPELRVGKSGTAWCTLSVATQRRRRAEGGDFEEHTDWHDVRLFGDLAQWCGKEVTKGAKLEVEGTLAYDLWTDDDGNRRRAARILASQVRLATASPGAARVALE